MQFQKLGTVLGLRMAMICDTNIAHGMEGPIF